MPRLASSLPVGRLQRATHVICILAALVAAVVLAAAGGARAADLDADGAELETKRPELARELLEQAVRAKPEDVAARLALGRAYYALGQYGEAKIEFETVLRFDNLPPDLKSQAQIYDQAAAQYLEEGRRLTSFGYAELGAGRYRINSTSDTTGGERDDLFFKARVGGGLNYALPDRYALDASLDYRFRDYDNSDTRNDSDWRWRLAASRALGENNVAAGFRGRVSYRGDGDYRNDYSVFTTYSMRLDPDNQIAFGADVRRRSYPEGRLRENSRSTAEASAGWMRSLLDGRAGLEITAHGGYNYATSRPDGDSAVYGATVKFDYAFTSRLGGFVFAWLERDSFNADDVRFHPDSVDGAETIRRRDNLYEFGGGLVWEFVRNWSLRPSVLYVRDQSNAAGFNYSSTEVLVMVRRGF
jgi:hypothetical protein